MDAVQFLKEVRRMCDTKADDCDGCPFEYSHEHDVCSAFDEPEKTVRIIAEWSKDHPVKTNAMKFEEVFGYKPYPLKLVYAAGTCDKNGTIRAHMMFKEWWDEPYPERGEE